MKRMREQKKQTVKIDRVLSDQRAANWAYVVCLFVDEHKDNNK